MAGNCGVQSSCSKSFLCRDPKSSDDFSLMDTSSPLWNFLWNSCSRKSSLLWRQSWVLMVPCSQCHDGVWSLPLPRLSWEIYSLIHLREIANKFLLASRNTGHAPDKHIWLKTQVLTWEGKLFKKARWPICWETLQTGGGIHLEIAIPPYLWNNAVSDDFKSFSWCTFWTSWHPLVSHFLLFRPSIEYYCRCRPFIQGLLITAQELSSYLHSVDASLFTTFDVHKTH